MIVAESLSKSYSGHLAISNVSFQIGEGEIVGLLGLNGAGKSTILKILGSFLLPSAGSARVGGVSVEEDPQAVRRMIGYLPDTPPLYDEMEVESYLRYVARLKNVEASDVTRRVELVLERTNLRGVRQARLSDLSHGYRQRAGIAQALVHNPKVLILDEPINGLDPVQIVEMRDLITSLKGQHTVVLSSHILSEITKTCDRILIMDQGKLVAEGSESELAASMSQNMRIVCDIESVKPGLVDSLKSIQGVQMIDSLKVHGSDRLTIQAERDVRAQVARVIVESGSGLTGLTRTEAGLEGLFMKLIKPAAEDRHL